MSSAASVIVKAVLALQTRDKLSHFETESHGQGKHERPFVHHVRTNVESHSMVASFVYEIPAYKVPARVVPATGSHCSLVVGLLRGP